MGYGRIMFQKVYCIGIFVEHDSQITILLQLKLQTYFWYCLLVGLNFLPSHLPEYNAIVQSWCPNNAFVSKRLQIRSPPVLWTSLSHRISLHRRGILASYCCCHLPLAMHSCSATADIRHTWTPQSLHWHVTVAFYLLFVSLPNY